MLKKRKEKNLLSINISVYRSIHDCLRRITIIKCIHIMRSEVVENYHIESLPYNSLIKLIGVGVNTWFYRSFKTFSFVGYSSFCSRVNGRMRRKRAI